MKHPFRKTMPLGLDIKIRLRLFGAYLAKQRRLLSAFGVGVLVPVMAMYLLFLNPNPAPVPYDTNTLVAVIQKAQAAEIEKSETGIYHVKRIIAEGSDKPTFVALTAGEAPEVPRRIDAVETWQHNETALALINSNGTERSFESYLSREHDDGLALHHYGPKDQSRETDREPYDAAHDLASLYTDYTSLERPTIPVLPAAAELTDVDEQLGTAEFVVAPENGLAFTYIVDLETNLIIEEIIYVVTEDTRYEMTRISYLDRSVIPADQFEEIFDPEAYAYELIAQT